ncbi:histidine kinase [Luteolibacter pohnpeiensis]|uniref:histidine kinase n=1 Tax=Luteolibacter pohnpeiensis TaxID=454153 RepID=UPI001906F044|nr:histidine kinase [Luteolibacter pohnpeiensis]
MRCTAAVALTPYQVDPHTLHLWHLDEKSPPFIDSSPDGFPLRSLHNGAESGQLSNPGLGHAISFNHHTGGTPFWSNLKGAILTIAPELSGDKSDNAPDNFRFQGDDGAFTYEALIKFDLLPEQSQTIALAILTMDGENDDRIFSFRIEREGFLSFSPLPDSGAAGGALASIPTTGPHAINTRDWFHVAVSYNGLPGTPGALRLFWTRIGSGVEEANAIGSGMLTANLARTTGDFAIGNEARSSGDGNAEAEPFPGLIDEVRMSSVARHPTDFIFIPPEKRVSPELAAERANDESSSERFELQINRIDVDGETIHHIPQNGSPLQLKPGLHRLDFDIGAISGLRRAVQLRSQLEGFNEEWKESSLGMSLSFEFLDAQLKPLSQAQFNMNGHSPGWDTGFAFSRFIHRRAPLLAPPNSQFLRVTLSSGAPDTSGSLGIDNLHIVRPNRPELSLWENGDFEGGVNILSPMRAPSGWQRGGDEPAIALVSTGEGSTILCLIDGDQTKSGKWSAIQKIDFDPGHAEDRSLMVSWSEAYNIIPGNQQRATFLNVPAGTYHFRAIGVTDQGPPTSASVSLELEVKPYFWETTWFTPAITASIISLIAIAILRHRHRRHHRRMHELSLQTALERDRTRIARDMHDDLGTRVSVLNLTASLARRSIGCAPEKASAHLDKISTASRELVAAMDELVWAVDPSNDHLDSLALQLTRHAEEVFQDSEIRCRLDIPPSLPHHPINSDLRHHVSMAVREAFHNILKHAGPCEVFLKFTFEAGQLEIEIRDNGRGFDETAANHGNGLINIRNRIRELGGTAKIQSQGHKGTLLVLQCPVPKTPHLRTP